MKRRGAGFCGYDARIGWMSERRIVSSATADIIGGIIRVLDFEEVGVAGVLGDGGGTGGVSPNALLRREGGLDSSSS